MAQPIIPEYCSTCLHKNICKIQINIYNFETTKDTFNTLHSNTELQKISSGIPYVCSYKLTQT